MTDLLQRSTPSSERALPKSPTGIRGLDEITGGGLPFGRPTLICGNAGCGKTLLAAEFLIHGALQYGEPGVFMSFEETAPELTQNVRSLGYDLDELVARKLINIDYVRVERSEIQETGEYDLEGLFIRLGYAIDSIGAKRVVLDTIESLFGGLSNDGILRAELRRLFVWLKGKGVTAIITGERGNGQLTRHGLEEYVSDCVILLDNRVIEQIATRRLRVVKYRGTSHGTNEYPFLIDESGIDVLPVTSAGLDHSVTNERVSTGIPGVDQMLGGQGVFRSASVLISGTAGTGKTTLAAHFADAACRRGEKCLFMSFEESAAQLVRNMRSIGLDLGRWVDEGLLHIDAARPTLHGLEAHLATVYKRVRDLEPRLVVMDPITNFISIGSSSEVVAMLLRMVDFFKSRQITSVFNSLTHPHEALETSDIGISSLIDTWLLVRDFESNGERTRGLLVLKSRGMAHSNQVREFVLTDDGVELYDVYLGPEGMVTGSTRVAQEARERTATIERGEEAEQTARELERTRLAFEAQVSILRAAYEAETERLGRKATHERKREQGLLDQRQAMAASRKTTGNGPRPARSRTGRKASP